MNGVYRIMLSNGDDTAMKSRAAFWWLRSFRVEVMGFALTLWSGIKEAGQRYWSTHQEPAIWVRNEN